MSRGLQEEVVKGNEVQRHWLSLNFDIAWAGVKDGVGWSDGHEQERVRQEQERQERERQERIRQERERQEREEKRQRQEWLRHEQELMRQEEERIRPEQERNNQEMLETAEGRQKLAEEPTSGGKALSVVDPEWLQQWLQENDLEAAFGGAKDDVLAEAMLALATKSKKTGVWNAQKDPALFSLLKKQVNPDMWNDTVTRKRGLGPRVCAGLWANGNYDQICELIELGVDTTLAANTEGVKAGSGIYSGFVQPIQHLIQGSLRDIAQLKTAESAEWEEERKTKAEGAQKIFQTLGDKAVTLTEWSAVEGSGMIEEFKKHPGTIWGFESIRTPYVQAAHETPQGVQPLRMMELWEAVEPSLDRDTYLKLLDKPEATIKDLVDDAVETIKGLMDTKEKFAEVKRDKDKFIANFERDATAFLTEFAAQMPKGTFIRSSRDTAGQSHQRSGDPSPIRVSEVTGIHWEKFMTGFACKAGLWSAKNENKPVYYCLDGIKMEDVTDYKKVKNKAIQAFLDAGGTKSDTMPHQEVITLVEVREILKNWHELKDSKGNDLVKIFEKGEILQGEKLEQWVKDGRANMADSNEEAGRTPAPPRDAFAKELHAIDPELFAKLQEGPEGDQDARDIVRKSNYLIKVAKTRPEIVLKYILSKCKVLIQYGLIPKELPVAAAHVVWANETDFMDKRVQLLLLIKECNQNFHEPLQAALVRLPLFRRGEQI